MPQQSEFWHWKHLECWQSWSHLSRSQNSNFGFCALLMMMKNPPVCACAFGTVGSLALLLQGKKLQPTLLRCAGAKAYIPPWEPCQDPQKWGAWHMLAGLWHEFPFQQWAATAVCPVPFTLLTPVSYIQVVEEAINLLFMLLKSFWEGKSSKETDVVLAGVDELCVCLLSWSSFTRSVTMFFFSKEEKTSPFQVLPESNGQIISDLSLILCFFHGKCGSSGKVMVQVKLLLFFVFPLWLSSYNGSETCLKTRITGRNFKVI